VLVSFAQHVRSGGVSQRKQHVRTQTVQVSLRAITTRFELDGEQSPVVTPQGKYNKKISQLLEGYKRKDPSQKFQLAVPLTVPAFMHTFSRTGTKKQQAVGDMALIAFYQSRRIHIVRNR
jgi:preprotein translocase subunit SecD